MNTIQQKNRKERPLVLGTGGGTGNLLPVAEGQEGITKTAHDLLLLRNLGNQLPGLPTVTKNIFEKAIVVFTVGPSQHTCFIIYTFQNQRFLASISLFSTTKKALSPGNGYSAQGALRFRLPLHDSDPATIN
jgi:hypothetical protein